MAYCSFDKKDFYKEYKSCYDKATLQRIAISYNRFHPENPVKNIEGLTHRQLWNEINHRFLTECDNKDEICWVERLKLDHDPLVKNSLLPKSPEKWLSKPRTWLTNFNIEDVMFQYEKATPKFKFLGVYPVDFSVKTGNGTCLYQETCTIDMKTLLNNGIQYIGMVINLDYSDEPGSHWVSLFICIDPKQNCYGAYFYDSYSGEPPKEVKDFMLNLQKQAKKLSSKTFKLDYNKVRHQYGGSECGMFSMVYLIRWMSMLKNNKDAVLDDIVNVRISDDDVFKLRQVFFRPPSSHRQLKKTT